MEGDGAMTHPTTDPQDELFDVLNPDGTPAGYTKTRREVHRDGDWHAALHIWVAGVCAEIGPYVVFQRRSPTKDSFAGLLDVAVGGHLRAGETLVETAREAEEEIGLALTLAALTRLGRQFDAGSTLGMRDREMHEVFAVRHDAPLRSYRLHPEEVSAIVAVPLDDALALFAGRRNDVAAVECPREAAELSVRLVVGDFVPFGGEYAHAALTRLRALLAGEPFEPFEIRSAG
jgi:isopentenyldiphosphate isomerase